MLKVNFDSGRDHIAMFEPFVLDTVSHMNADGALLDDVQKEIRTRHQLALPANTLKTLLARSCRGGFLRREAGRYWATERKPKVEDLRSERARVEGRQRELAEAFVAAAAEKGLKIASVEDALAHILTFFEEYHVSLALDEQTGVQPVGGREPDAEDRKETILVASFLESVILKGGRLADVVQEMLEGFVLQNALLLKDISRAARQFQNLHVYFDSIFLFGVLGLRGAAVETASRELLALLSDCGAVLNVFEPTIGEMRRILAVYEEKLATADGRKSLFATDLTRHVLTSHMQPSDIRTKSAMLERALKHAGLNVRSTPAHVEELTLNEAALGKRLAEYRGGEGVPRVVHDISCVAGVLTLRAGHTTDFLDDARAVFVTTSGSTVSAVTRWYGSQGGRGVPPIMHYLLLSNLAWLKRPASASKMKLHELVALCSAALRPSRDVWEKFLEHLRELEASGELTSDEVVAIIATGLTDSLLTDVEFEDDTDAASLSEVVERVKASYREMADSALADARREVDKSAAEADKLRASIAQRANGISAAVSWLLSIILIVLLAIALAAGVGLISAGGWLAVALGLVLAIVGLLNLVYGAHVIGWRRAVQRWLCARIYRWLGGTPAQAP